MEKANPNLKKPTNVRVRIAPAPTGPLHIGNARTALFNYLFAKKYNGKFILRVEDTDKKRSKPEYERGSLESLKWLGLNWDEGPDVGGDYGPYRQTERMDIYEKYLKKLLDNNQAYYCFCSEEELEAQRQYQMSRGEAPIYSGKCKSLSKEEVEKKLKERQTAIIRFKIATDKKVSFNDLIRDKIEVDPSLIGDIAIAKNLRMPLYNFAVVVDDFEMKITHIIRGEDHISNTPKQILIQEALDFPRPIYAHLSLILGPDRTKLSKRHGDVALSQYKKEGYLPEAIVNFLAFLGWNPGGEREIYSIPSLIKEFSLEKCQKGGAVFNIKRLDWLNGFYIRNLSAERLTERCIPYLVKARLLEETTETNSAKLFPVSKEEIPKEYKKYKIKETKENVSFDWLSKVIAIYQERLKKLSEASELTQFFFKKQPEYDETLLKWKQMNNNDVVLALDKLEKILSKIETIAFVNMELEKTLTPEAEKFPQEMSKTLPAGDRGYLLWPFRVALTGMKASAGPFEIAELLGKEKTLERIKAAKNLIS